MTKSIGSIFTDLANRVQAQGGKDPKTIVEDLALASLKKIDKNGDRFISSEEVSNDTKNRYNDVFQTANVSDEALNQIAGNNPAVFKLYKQIRDAVQSALQRFIGPGQPVLNPPEKQETELDIGDRNEIFSTHKHGAYIVYKTNLESLNKALLNSEPLDKFLPKISDENFYSLVSNNGDFMAVQDLILNNINNLNLSQRSEAYGFLGKYAGEISDYYDPGVSDIANDDRESLRWFGIAQDYQIKADD